MDDGYRIGEAARVLGVRVETVRRWERDGRLRTTRSPGGQRRVPAEEVARVLEERRSRRASGSSAQSVRNHFPGVIVAVKLGEVAATVELMAGPHRILSLVTREAVEELGLRPGMAAVAAVKATNVSIDLADRATIE
jgi:molybdopterin-binding protein